MRAVIKEKEGCLKPHLELYDEEYFWKHLGGKSSGVSFVATIQVEGDNITYFDPDDDLTPEDALVWGDEEYPRPVVKKKKYMKALKKVVKNET